MEAKRITREDLEAKLREIRGEVDDVKSASTPYAIAAGAVVLVTVVGVVYLLGRRRGRQRATYVEVRRV
jgi:hypothetical protein